LKSRKKLRRRLRRQLNHL